MERGEGRAGDGDSRSRRLNVLAKGLGLMRRLGVGAWYVMRASNKDTTGIRFVLLNVFPVLARGTDSSRPSRRQEAHRKCLQATSCTKGAAGQLCKRTFTDPGSLWLGWDPEVLSFRKFFQ